MALVKKSLTLPEDLYKWAEKQSKKIARETGGPENVSAVVREALAREKQRLESQKQAA